ncbi:DEAD/DEAH box helicase [Erysipelotrichaceae bacterium 51-3]
MNIHSFRKGLDRAFVEASTPASQKLTPDLLYNDAKKGQKVYLALEQELQTCKSFSFSIAFITQSGLQLLKPILRRLEARGIPGRILTTDYLCFTEPKALDDLCRLKNIELRLYQCENLDGYHTKGYFFEHDAYLSLVIGSSNLTDSALCTNQEWNARLISMPGGEVTRACMEQFDKLFHSIQAVDYRKVREMYHTQYELVHTQRQKAQAQLEKKTPAIIKPNLMQVELIENLRRLIDQNQHRALLVSATGTGKTYAAAFAVQAFKPRRILFLVHREQVVRKARDSFEAVLGKEQTYGILAGSQKDLQAEYLFSTVQSFCRPQIYQQFGPESFDWIIIDEVHRAAADSYQRIFEYFTPQFWLGMSATPSRTDGQNIFELFDYNVACKVSIRDALEEDLLCPFHYYAIDELEIDNEKAEDLSSFNQLIDEEKLEHILRETEYYGYCGSRLKGLIFVSNRQEAKALSQMLNERGLRTLALDGQDSIARREEAIERLTSDQGDDLLDYLITVDIFNEGIDIPQVNQVVLLRPTQSAVIFIQQLGRGLRKAEGKDYVVVLDFVGLYQNDYTYRIPQALSEDVSGKKDVLRRFVVEGNKSLPGCSTIHFSEQAKSRIFKSIEKATMNSAAVLMEGWQALEQQLGRTPRLVDFDRHEAMDPLLIFSNSSYGCYVDFLKKKAKVPGLPTFTDLELDFLRFISRKWANGKRPHELWMLESILEDQEDWKNRFEKKLEKAGYPLAKKTWTNLKNQFKQEWIQGQENEVLRDKDVIFLDEDEDGNLHLHDSFKTVLKSDAFQDQLKDLIGFGLQRWKRDYTKFEDDTWLNLNRTYTYADSFRLLDFEKGMVAQNVGGYVHEKINNVFPVYINYDKAETIADSIAYEDHFESPTRLIAYSKARRSLTSADVKAIAGSEQTGMKIPLFLRKNTKEQGKEFYYLGLMKPDGHFEEQIMPKVNARVVQIGYQLEHPVRFDLYDYFTTT